MTDLDKRIAEIEGRKGNHCIYGPLFCGGTIDLTINIKEDIPFLLDQLKKHRQALDIAKGVLDFYGSGRHLWAESKKTVDGVNVCAPIGSCAQLALEKINQILGEEK